MYYKALLTAIALMGTALAHAQQCFCLKSANGKSGFSLKMALTDDDWKQGYVQYGAAAEKIPIVFKGSKELEQHDGRPSYFRYTWDEMYQGKKTGTYVLCIQGANVYESYYLRAKDKKKFDLERVITEDDCKQCFAQ